MLRLLLVLELVPVITMSRIASAQYEERSEFQQFLKDHNSNSSKLFSSSPIYHITPERRTISLALSTDLLDTTIASDGTNILNGYDDDLDHFLRVSGWAASPLITISTKNFGFGFASENGKKRSHYLRLESSEKSFVDTSSKLNYSGFAIFGYFIPKIRRVPNWIIPTLIAGYRSISAEQEYMTPRFSQESNKIFTKYRYNIKKSHLGVNLGIRLARKFTIIPWYDFTNVQIGAVKSEDPDAPEITSSQVRNPNTGIIENQNTPYVAIFLEDRKLFWEFEPERTYGLDFAIKFGQLDIHFGGILGSLAAASHGADRIYNANYSLSASYSMKSR